MEIQHGVFEKSSRKPPTFGKIMNQPSIFESYGNTVQFQNQNTPFDRSINRLFNLIKLLPYQNLVSSLQAAENDKNKIVMLEREIARIWSENWVVPNSEIQGLSGYVCRRCNSLGFEPIRDPGYDMTMQSRHRCDEERVKSIMMVSIRPSDVQSLYDTVANMMHRKLSRLAPLAKYLVAVDVSMLFDFLERKMDTVLAKECIGIPNRYYLYSVKNGEKIEWLQRVLANLGKKTAATELEIKDFLARAQATYAYFEMTSGRASKRYLISIIS